MLLPSARRARRGRSAASLLLATGALLTAGVPAAQAQISQAVLDTGIPFDLVEADRRKAVFLQEAARVTEAPVTVRCQRIEAGGVPPARLVTARALAPLPRLLGYAHPLLQPGGACLFHKGAELDAELAACTDWRMRVERFPAPDRAGSVVLRVTELSRA